MATVIEDVIAGSHTVLTFTAGAAIVAGQVVGMETDGSPADMTVKPMTLDGVVNMPVGVAVDSIDSGEVVPVAVPPSVVYVRNESGASEIVAGEFVGLSADEAGEVTDLDLNESYNQLVVGQALDNIAADATGRIRLDISY
ncbi:MAG: DUF2190 family protein [Halanaerobiales bacterium]|nr:DUF2190 family protein [Halanaerobiales bacterium]